MVGRLNVTRTCQIYLPKAGQMTTVANDEACLLSTSLYSMLEKYILPYISLVLRTDVNDTSFQLPFGLKNLRSVVCLYRKKQRILNTAVV